MASVGEGGEYERRRPELTVLYEAVQRGWPSVQESLPERIREEVRRFLERGLHSLRLPGSEMRGMPAALAHRVQLQEKGVVPRMHDEARSGGGAAAERPAALRGAPAVDAVVAARAAAGGGEAAAGVEAGGASAGAGGVEVAAGHGEAAGGDAATAGRSGGLHAVVLSPTSR